MGGNGWLAQVGADPKQRAREIGHVHSAFVAAAGGPVGAVREVVAQSWLRSSDARVAQDADPPVTLTDGDLHSYREDHPLARVVDVLRQIVGTAAEDGDHLMAVSDADGRLLWVEGNRSAREQAARFNFVEGALWDEAHAGTNAPGTALALDHEVQIFATEHFLPTVQAWTCAAAPIHDPATGRILGVIDITGGDIVANPHSLALVRAAARACEAALWVPSAAVRPRLRALGLAEGTLQSGTGRALRLTRRHTELLVLLSLHQEGLSGWQLADLVFDDPDTNPTTLRVELTRLRRVVGELLRSRPYRLGALLDADYLEVAADLRRDDVHAAVAGYAGPLLPSSEAPGVSAHRRWLDTRLRAAVLADRSPALVRSWADGPGFHDLEVWEHLAGIAPSGGPDHGVALARSRQLRTEWGLPQAPPGPGATFAQRRPD